jgi:hypothetical protein
MKRDSANPEVTAVTAVTAVKAKVTVFNIIGKKNNLGGWYI